MRKVITFLIIIVFCPKLFASSGSPFSRDAYIGAENIAMGGAVEAVTKDVYAVYWNPAGLTQLRNRKQNVNQDVKEKLYNNDIDSITEEDLENFSDYSPKQFLEVGGSASVLAKNQEAGFAGMSFNMKNLVFGTGVYYLRTAEIVKYDESAIKKNDEGYNAGIGYFSVAYPFEFVSIGMTAKGLYENVQGVRYYGGGADFGLQADMIPLVSFGLVVQDLGQGMKTYSKKEGLSNEYDFSSPSVRMNVAFSSRSSDFILSLGLIRNLNEKNYSWKMGMKYNFVNNFGILFGFKGSLMSAGFAMTLWRVELSYAVCFEKFGSNYNNTVTATVVF